MVKVFKQFPKHYFSSSLKVPYLRESLKAYGSAHINENVPYNACIPLLRTGIIE